MQSLLKKGPNMALNAWTQQQIYKSYFVVQNMTQLLYDQPLFWWRSPFSEINNVITNSLLLGLKELIVLSKPETVNGHWFAVTIHWWQQLLVFHWESVKFDWWISEIDWTHLLNQWILQVGVIKPAIYFNDRWTRLF